MIGNLIRLTNNFDVIGVPFDKLVEAVGSFVDYVATAIGLLASLPI